jgi:hypothetical protein
MEKIRIRDEHPGSATLLEAQSNFSAKLEFNGIPQKRSRSGFGSEVRSLILEDQNALGKQIKKISCFVVLDVSRRLEGFPGACTP